MGEEEIRQILKATRSYPEDEEWEEEWEEDNIERKDKKEDHSIVRNKSGNIRSAVGEAASAESPSNEGRQSSFDTFSLRSDFVPVKTLELKKTGRSTSQKMSIKLGMGFHIPDLTLDTTWLRDECTCAQCRNTDSGQKTYASTQVPDIPLIQSAERLDDGSLKVFWQDDFLTGGLGRGEVHESVYSYDWLVSLTKPAKKYVQHPLEWEGSSFLPLWIEYSEWMEGGEAFSNALLSLDRTGLIFVRNVPGEETSVETIASKIGNLYETFYGRTWDVRSKPNAENVAYTNEFLGLHQDLMYKSDPPRIQLLHCIENSCTGGESMFSDGRAAARKLSHTAYAALQLWKVRYGYDRNGYHYNYERAVIEGDLDRNRPNAHGWEEVDDTHNPTRHGDFNEARRWRLAWSPPFQCQQRTLVTDLDKGRYHSWKKHALEFQQHLEHPSAQRVHRMQPGDCVLFDNWRVLHGRNQFDVSSGHRWLKGAYLDHQVFDSKVKITLREMERQGRWSPVQEAPLLGMGSPDLWNVAADAKRRRARDAWLRQRYEESGF